MTAASNPAPHKAWYRILYLQVLIAVFLGILIGYFFPEVGKSLKPLGDGFIKLVKMIIAPIIFCTVVHGIASMSDLKKLGRIGGKTLLYFEVVSTLALVIGLVVVNVLKPGAGFNIDPTTLDPEHRPELRDRKRTRHSSWIPAQHHPAIVLRRLRQRRPAASAARRHSGRVRHFFHGRTRQADPAE